MVKILQILHSEIAGQLLAVGNDGVIYIGEDYHLSRRTGQVFACANDFKWIGKLPEIPNELVVTKKHRKKARRKR